MLIHWVGILSILGSLCMPNFVDAQEVHGPSPPQQSTPSSQDQMQGQKEEPQEPLSKQAPSAEQVLKSLPAKPDYTVIPLPAVSYNRNEGYWVGGLAPILKANEKGDIEDIWAPQYLYNQYVGNEGSLSYYGYPSDKEQYQVLAWYAQKVDRGIEFAYKNIGMGGGRYIFAVEGSAFKNPFARFFGFGNGTTEGQETNYTSREGVFKLTAGINLTPNISVMLTERYRDVRIDNGVVSSLPATKQQFSTIPGIGGAQILGHALTVRYNTRDNQLMPKRGSYVNLSAEFNQNLHHEEENQWGHTTLDARHYIPHASDRMVFVSRVFFDGVFGQRSNDQGLGIPFYEQPTLGGENTLRAFGRSRYIDSFAVLLNLEERIPLIEKTIFDHSIELELAPFLDAGRVGSSNVHAVDLLFKDVQFNPGAGIRLLAKPNVVGRFDVGYGRDGMNAFVGLDYPF
ncbi:MAG TPA: BamA/TamA family outer membrane protein [Nitrospira sp.]|nr:BamA/TamA family outer membrane protein [Nitrospira sp.]